MIKTDLLFSFKEKNDSFNEKSIENKVQPIVHFFLISCSKAAGLSQTSSTVISVIF